jgi:hypothetical protein
MAFTQLGEKDLAEASKSFKKTAKNVYTQLIFTAY